MSWSPTDAATTRWLLSSLSRSKVRVTSQINSLQYRSSATVYNMALFTNEKNNHVEGLVHYLVPFICFYFKDAVQILKGKVADVHVCQLLLGSVRHLS